MLTKRNHGMRAALLAPLVGFALASLGNACSGDPRPEDADEQSEDVGLGLGGTSFEVGGGGAEAGPDLSNVFDTCAEASANGERMIDDFDDGDRGLEGDGRLGGWFAYEDDSGGSQTPTQDDFLPERGGIDDQGYALRMTGSGFTAWGAGCGFVFVGDCAYDASVHDGVTFWARGAIDIDPEAPVDPFAGDGEVLKVLLTELEVVPLDAGGECDPEQGECYDSHKVRISLGACWRRYVLPFSEFEQDGWGLYTAELDLDRLVSMSFEVARAHVYDFWIDEIAFYRGEPPAELEDCTLGDLAQGAGGAGGGNSQ